MAGFEIVSEVTTRETDFDGTRHSDWSDWTSTTAPAGHVINQNEVKVEWLSDNGSENSHEIIYENLVEIIPGTGIKLPQTIKVRTYARSPKGKCWVGRGWSKIKVTGEFTKYK
jgi:hypothetical protein